MTDYSTSKYEDALTEAAYLATLDGGADAEAGDVEAGGWYGLVTLTAEDATAAEADNRPLRDQLLTGSRVIIRQDSQGFVWTHYGPAHPEGDPAAYRALMAEWEAIEADTYGPDEDYADGEA